MNRRNSNFENQGRQSYKPTQRYGAGSRDSRDRSYPHGEFDRGYDQERSMGSYGGAGPTNNEDSTYGNSEYRSEYSRPSRYESDYGSNSETASRNYDSNFGTSYGTNSRSGYDSNYGNPPRYDLTNNSDYRSRSDYTPSSTYSEKHSGTGAYRSGSRRENYGFSHPHHEEGVWESVKNFFGMGPKGYKRSDERIREDVSEALYRHPGVDASEIEVSVEDGVVILRGSVEERKAKRLAEDCAEDCSGVSDVRNEIRVTGSQARSSASTLSSDSALGKTSLSKDTKNKSSVQ